jgi:hypothetical protein
LKSEIKKQAQQRKPEYNQVRLAWKSYMESGGQHASGASPQSGRIAAA